LGDEHLRFAVLQLEPAQLPSLGRPTPLGAEPLRGSGDLTAAGGERLGESLGNPGDLEVTAVLAGALIDLIATLGELVCERRAVVGADLPRGAEDRPRGDRDDPPVLAHGARDHDMAVQLRVGRVAIHHAPGGGVPVLRGHQVHGVLLHDLPAVAPAHGRHRLGEVRDRLAHGRGVRRLHIHALGLVAERPHRGHGLRRAERDVDPSRASPTGALPAKPPTAARMLALHQRDEVPALDRCALDAEHRQRVGARQPLARRLRRLATWVQVVVAQLWGDRL
jgi:hypothetical protein